VILSTFLHNARTLVTQSNLCRIFTFAIPSPAALIHYLINKRKWMGSTAPAGGKWRGVRKKFVGQSLLEDGAHLLSVRMKVKFMSFSRSR
jgi:hypothetical protein